MPLRRHPDRVAIAFSRGANRIGEDTRRLDGASCNIPRTFKLLGVHGYLGTPFTRHDVVFGRHRVAPPTRLESLSRLDHRPSGSDERWPDAARQLQINISEAPRLCALQHLDLLSSCS